MLEDWITSADISKSSDLSQCASVARSCFLPDQRIKMTKLPPIFWKTLRLCDRFYPLYVFLGTR